MKYLPLATVTGEYDGVPIGTAVRMIEGTLLGKKVGARVGARLAVTSIRI